jgi:hypothetical protein
MYLQDGEKSGSVPCGTILNETLRAFGTWGF